MPIKIPPSRPLKDWFLREWMTWLNKRQADISRDLGWDRARVSKIYNSRQPYARGDVAELAAWLSIEPYELLMPPSEAMGLRGLRRAAAQIVAEAEPPPFDHSRSLPVRPTPRRRVGER